MAFSPVKKFLSDLNPNIGVGVNLPLSGPSVFISNYTTKEAIKNNLINYFLTNPGELPLNPTFGSGLRSYIFEQISQDLLSNLEEYIIQKINFYFSMISIDSLVITQQEDTNLIRVILKYNIIDTNMTDTLNIQL